MRTTTDEPSRALGDTNVLIRFAIKLDAQHEMVLRAVTQLDAAGYEMCYAPQSLREPWNVVTRPKSANGLGYAIPEVDAFAAVVEKFFTLLHDTEAMNTLWRRLVVEHEVRGVQVHDARLAASALVGGCRAVLNLNDPDFKRFGVPALHPRDVPVSIASA